MEKQNQELAEQNAAQTAKIVELVKDKTRLEALWNTDGTNSGIPTSSTPINKKKVIPNSRQKTGKKIGGQEGHAKKKLERFDDSEVDTYVEHVLDECPECQCTDLEDTGVSYLDSVKVVKVNSVLQSKYLRGNLY